MKSASANRRVEELDAETAELSYAELRKRDRPFVLPLDPANPEPVERAAYDASYKGVTDMLTLYLWRRPAFYLTRWAARGGHDARTWSPLIGAILCVAAFFLSGCGHYWLGVASGFVFMVLDTVDGKLARCTGASSKWGNVFDHGIDLVHPPFWWWAWAARAGAYGRPFEPVYATMVLWAIVGGYVVQRVIEGIFMRRFGGMHIHVWRPIDSRFRLITARRNPNMVILRRRAAVRPARHRPRAGRLVDARQPDLPRRSAGPGRARSGARRNRSSPGSRMTAAPRSCSPARGRAAIRSRQQFGTDLKALIPVARRADGAAPGARHCSRAREIERGASCSRSSPTGSPRVAARTTARLTVEHRGDTIAATCCEPVQRPGDALAAAGHDRRPCAARRRR